MRFLVIGPTGFGRLFFSPVRFSPVRFSPVHVYLRHVCVLLGLSGLFGLFFLSGPSAAAEPTVAVQRGHVEAVAGVDLSPDESFVLSGGYREIKLWDASSGREIRTFYGHGTSVNAVRFSPDGRTVLSGAGNIMFSEVTDNSLRLWDAATGEELKRFEGHTAPVRDARFLPGGRRFLSASMDKTVRLWDVETGEVVRVLNGHTAAVESIDLSPDGRRAASAGADGTVRIWDTATGRAALTLEPAGRVFDVCYSPDGDSLLSASAAPPSGASGGAVLTLWNPGSGERRRSFSIEDEVVMGVRFHPSGRYAAVAVKRGYLRLYELDRGREIRSFRVQESVTSGLIAGLCFSSDGTGILTGSTDGTLAMWDPRTAEALVSYTGRTDRVNSVAISPRGRFILLGTGGAGGAGQLRLWDLDSGGESGTFGGRRHGVRSVRFSPDGNYALSGGADNTVRLWDVKSGRELALVARHSRGVDDVCFSPDGLYAASGASGAFKGADRSEIVLIDLKARKPIRRLHSESLHVNSLCFSPDGGRVLTGSDNGTVQIIDVETGEWAGQYPAFETQEEMLKAMNDPDTWPGHTADVRSICFSPDGKRLLSAGFDRTVKLWDTESGGLVTTFEGHGARVESVCFSPRGRLAMSGAWDGEVKLWDVRSGRELHSMRGHSVVVTDVCISPDRRYGLSAGADGTVRMWSLAGGECMAILIPFTWIERGQHAYDRRITRSDWAVVTPDGYFDASSGGAEQAFFVDGMKVISLKQLADIFYKPGLLKRLLDGEQFTEGVDVGSIATPPEVELRLAEAGAGTAELVIEARDTGGGIEDLAVFRNNRIVRTEMDGRAVSSGVVRATCRVDLVPGDNTFTAMAYSRDRVKSFSEGVTVRTGRENETEKELYVLAAGIDDYGSPETVGDQKGLLSKEPGADEQKPDEQEPGAAHQGAGEPGAAERESVTRFADLRLAAKDAGDFVERYRQVYPDEYTALHATLLLDGEATKPRILDALDELARKADSNDRVVVYFSGHGYAMPRRYGKLPVITYYYVPHDYHSFERLASTGLSSRELMDRLSVVPAEEIFLLFDTCQSGGAEESFANDMFGSLRLFGEDTGMFIMASSAAAESSLELSDLDNGLFTHALLSQISPEELPSRGLTFRQAAEAVGARMQRIVQRVTMGRLTQTLVATQGEDALIAEP